MSSYLRIIRLPNLIFIAFIQFVIRQVVLVPILQTYGFNAGSETGMLFLLITATVLIAAGGYALNDYFDIKIDIINKPDKQVVGKEVSRKQAMLFYQILTVVGTVCGLLLAFFVSSFTLALIFIVVPGLLWFYSATYKRQFLSGNLVVSFLSMLCVLVVGITEIAVLQKEYGKLIFETPIPANFYGWVGGFAVFAFLCTWIREIIKDLEDEIGDREMECRTMAIKWGTSKTKIFLYSLIAVTISALYLAEIFLIPFQGTLTIRYITFGVVLPFAALIYLIATAKAPADYHHASTLAKVIMLAGVLYSFIFYFLQAKTYGISMFNLFLIQ